MTAERMVPTRVERTAPIAVWEKTAPGGMDTALFWVSRTLDGNLSIGIGGRQIMIPAELVPWFAEAVAVAAVWTTDD